MARLYPTNIPEDIPDSESRVLELIAEDLDDDYSAFWSVKTVGRDDSGRMRVGEADIVLLHPRRGLLVIEAKGGGIGYDGERRQYRANDQFGGTHTIDNPYEQASGRMYDILARIRDRNLCSVPGRRFAAAHGYAVVLPDSRLKNVDLPPDAPREITLDSEDLEYFRPRIEAVYRHWRSGRECRDMTDDEFRSIRDRILMPSYQLSYSLSAELSTGSRTIVRLTDDQCAMLDVFDEISRALIRGSAGTGKTFLLMEKARRLCEQGRRVLVLCFNNPLSRHLQEMAAQTSLRADVMTFHELCRQVVESTGGEFSVPDDSEARAEYFRALLPEQAFDACDRYTKRWDAILVDEGQDFDSTWWTCIESLSSGPDSCFYIFYDSSQCVYSVQQGFPFQEPRFPIKDNCRNTKNICLLLQSVLPEAEIHIRDSAPIGRMPAFINVGANPLQTLDSLIDHLVTKESVAPEQIVVLSPHTHVRSLLSGRNKAGKCSLADLDNRTVDSVAFSTISRFKGLESDVVVVIDVDSGHDNNQLYTAFSRAKQLLYVLHDDSYAVPKVKYEPGSQAAPRP